MCGPEKAHIDMFNQEIFKATQCGAGNLAIELPTCRQAMDECQEDCACKTCDRDVVGMCGADEGDCLDCRDQRMCPVQNCPNYQEG